MRNEKIHIERIKRLLEREQSKIHPQKHPATALFCHSADPIPYEALEAQNWQNVQIGQSWGKLWESAWFKLQAVIPPQMENQVLALWFDCEGEACVWREARPWQGFTPKVDWYHKAAKYLFPLGEPGTPGAKAGAAHEILIEAAANGLFGASQDEFHLAVCQVVSIDTRLRKLLLDIALLLDLALELPKGMTRRQRILWGLNRVCDLWQSDRAACEQILDELLAQPANASALTAYSVGHAHIDLAWLWPMRETKRKGGRSFANALRLMQEYPDYIFGASQAQLYKWMRDIYPPLWQEIKQAVKAGRWEVQGAGWVEFDTNLPSGESIIRQLCYGLRFFEDEFGISPRGLWLPDCFGFNANLPQLLTGAGLEWFMTQKLSWNESNPFNHNLFVWEGIDGSRILAHQLPTHDYNFSNNPSSFLQTETRYAQSEVCDAFLNLYGIGDGGGGPTRDHIEYGIRQQNLEGVPRFKFAKGQDFFDHITDLDRSLLPKLYGELYLELHRGTYTTQGLVKKHNRHSERLLSAAEFVASLCAEEYPALLEQIWEDTLLLQFHDIIPGSSITPVYEESKQINTANHQKLMDYIIQSLQRLYRANAEAPASQYAILNANAWQREEWLEFDIAHAESTAKDAEGNALPTLLFPDKLLVKVKAEPWSLSQISWEPGSCQHQIALPTDELEMENEFLRVSISPQGTLKSVILKANGAQMLASESNLIQLWEDEPNNWGAWDVNHFYRDTLPIRPHSVRLIPEQSWKAEGSWHSLCFEIKISNSTILQRIELNSGCPWLRISHEVDWQEHHKMLRAHFFPAVHADFASFEIAMGTLKRSTKPSNSYEDAKFEVPAHRWVDLSQSDRGCALLNDCKYGHRIIDNEMDINLLRSPADVDPQADIGSHSYSYGFYPHLYDAVRGEVLPQAHLFNAPMLATPLGGAPIMPQLPKFELGSQSAKLETIKPKDRGEGIILRLYEYGGAASTAELKLPDGFVFEALCDLRERPLAEQPQATDGVLNLSFNPFEIKTLLIKKEGK